MKDKILCLDFDGVIHSYVSGWKGPRNIPDPPVPGALEFLLRAQDHFQVCIFSSRSRSFGGRKAIKRWLRYHYEILALGDWKDIPEWLNKFLSASYSMDPWDEEVKCASRKIIKGIKFPTRKPPAHLTIDDRAITFGGKFPDFDYIKNFKPWNKKG